MWNYVTSGTPPGRHGRPDDAAPVGKPAAGIPGPVFPRRREPSRADTVEQRAGSIGVDLADNNFRFSISSVSVIEFRQQVT